MHRLICAAALVSCLALPAVTTGRASVRQPIYFWSSTANAISVPKGQGPAPNRLVIRPSGIALFADGSWDVEHLHWSGWGSSTARATGISSASNGIPDQA